MFLSYLKKESGKERTFIQIAKQKFLLQKSLTITISIFLIMTISSTPFFPHKEDLVVCCKVPPIDFQSPERRLHKWVLSVWMSVRMSYFSNSKKKRFEIANIYLSIQSSLYFLIHFSKRLPRELLMYVLPKNYGYRRYLSEDSEIVSLRHWYNRFFNQDKCHVFSKLQWPTNNSFQ